MKTLIDIQKKLKAPKGQFNSFGKYNYRSCEDILEALKPLCSEYGAQLTLSDTTESVGGFNYVKATATFLDATGTSVSVCAYAREAKDKKGMDDAQITGACSSYARKYALNGLFLIDDTKDADTDEATQKRTEAKPTQATPDDAKEMKSKYKGFCKSCNGDIALGDDIIYSKKYGVYHPDCFQVAMGAE